MVHFSFQVICLLLVPSLWLQALLLLAHLIVVRHSNRWYWVLPGLLMAASGSLLWALLPQLLAPAYCFSLVFFGLLAAVFLPWLPQPTTPTRPL
ncbi:hypothetical protein KLP40_14745 [Hymenobacter sp. NST-14]|uniref:hypothetical protein n=1 Tax=Hymenobacter piscis TaxID=2839984 RepID=UPI001C01015F|nr:hypothetical protein [Hymenobacter piscis]MBT9394427.1 hypothetical protein [Hymenobacter piscis]